VVTAAVDGELAREVASAVVDPEIPVLTIADLGILRGVELDGATVTVTITPTYSGCPAIEAIEQDVRSALRAAGFTNVAVRRTLSPAWTTDWMSEAGKRKLLEYGIAPPSADASRQQRAGDPVPLTLSVRCPQCGSPRTHELSHFGSTACKSLWACDDCREPFDHFKVL
jgi:ring-1,2-phenylacetyl-CoA epoxidase subunit PaaD